MDRGEFQQDSVLKQLEVLKEEEKEFQNLKVRRAPGYKTQPWNPVLSSDGPNPKSIQQMTASREEKARGQLGGRYPSLPKAPALPTPTLRRLKELMLRLPSSLPQPPHM